VKKVVVIADDLSGAAELAAVAWRHGLTAEVQTTFYGATDADVVCVDTDTRTASANDAARRVSVVMSHVVSAEPAWVFKKCDSVLRGSVTAETRAVAQAIGMRDILLVPANPSRGRIIRNGIYFVEGQPLHETAFARDPHDPRRSSQVIDLLGEGAERVIVPDAVTADDVMRIARATHANTLPVGAADFFAALLRVRCPQTARTGAASVTASKDRRSKLLVCGSAFAWPERRRSAERDETPVFALPNDIGAVADALRSTGRALVGIGEASPTIGQTPELLTDALADSVLRILTAISVDLILLEGGSTAAAVLRKMNWTRLSAKGGVEASLVEFFPAEAAGPAITIKPGSYAWPVEVWP
jgi:D-threonate/D-erythronate kinase